MIVVIKDTDVARKLAKDIHKKSQTMFYDYAERPSGSLVIYGLTGYTKSFITLKDNGYIVQAFDENGNAINEWLNTNIADTTSPTKWNFKKYNIEIRIKGCGNSKRCNSTILDLSKQNYINGGSYNANRNCYYPATDSKQYTAQVNKLNKLFTKWGFKSL